MTTPLTHLPFHLLSGIPADADLVAEVRALNKGGVDVGWAWAALREPLRPDNPDQVMLTFGVHGDVGILEWMHGNTFSVPETGTNTDWVTYRMAGLDEIDLPPHAQVPVTTVYAALTEFIATGGEQPLCIEWQEAASRLTRFSGPA